MAGTTARGYPYASSTDPIAAGAAKMQELAQKVDDSLGLLKSDNVTVSGLVTGTAISTTVAFPGGGFPGTPRVVATVRGTTAPQLYPVSVTDESPTGCKVWVTRASGSTGAVSVTYHAHY